MHTPKTQHITYSHQNIQQRRQTPRIDEIGQRYSRSQNQQASRKKHKTSNGKRKKTKRFHISNKRHQPTAAIENLSDWFQLSA